MLHISPWEQEPRSESSGPTHSWLSEQAPCSDLALDGVLSLGLLCLISHFGRDGMPEEVVEWFGEPRVSWTDDGSIFYFCLHETISSVLPAGGHPMTECAIPLLNVHRREQDGRCFLKPLPHMNPEPNEMSIAGFANGAEALLLLCHIFPLDHILTNT